jgi:hypothetical protein
MAISAAVGSLSGEIALPAGREAIMLDSATTAVVAVDMENAHALPGARPARCFIQCELVKPDTLVEIPGAAHIG